MDICEFYLASFWDSISCNSGWLWICYVAKDYPNTCSFCFYLQNARITGVSNPPCPFVILMLSVQWYPKRFSISTSTYFLGVWKSHRSLCMAGCVCYRHQAPFSTLTNERGLGRVTLTYSAFGQLKQEDCHKSRAVWVTQCAPGQPGLWSMRSPVSKHYKQISKEVVIFHRPGEQWDRNFLDYFFSCGFRGLLHLYWLVHPLAIVHDSCQLHSGLL